MRMRSAVLCLAAGLLWLGCVPGGAATDSVQRIKNGVEITAAGQHVRVQFYGDGIVRVLKWPDRGKPDKTSLSVVVREVPELGVKVADTASAVTLDSGGLRVRIASTDGALEFSARGEAILKEQGGAAFAPCPIEREKAAFGVRQAFALTPEEGLYGLGQHQSGYMNYRGKTVNLVQANTEAVTPVLVSTAGWGILWDNYSKTVFADGARGASLWSEVADNVDYYLLYGPSLDRVIARYRQLTGPAPMYGKWAYGYWQSKEHYASRHELLAIAAEYRKRRIPIDSLIQDWNYWGGMDMWGGMLFDEKKYPRPAEMIDLLHKQNFHIIISIWPGLGPASPIHQDMARRGFLYSPVGWAGFRYYDAYNPAANDLYWKYASAGLFSKGIDGWWIDSTEPDIVNALTKEAEEYEMKRVEDNHLGSFARYLNPYSLVMTDAIYRNQRKETSDKRVYILTRSTFAGQQRAAATTWSGDIGASWDVLGNQIAAGINHSMAGIPYWTFDIGAFSLGCQGGVFSNGGIADPSYRELYTRMFQFGAFCPIFRSHGSETPREIWGFGEYADTLVRFDNLRYRLMPYIYSVAWRVTHDGYSILRGMPMDFPRDRKTYSIGDQFLFGPGILVAPVTRYMYHRPPEPTVLVDGQFRTRDGKPGLNVKYYCDAEFKNLCREAVEPNINLNWYTGWPAFITGPKFSMRWEGKLIPAQSGKHRFNMKSFGPRRVYLNGKEVAHNYDSMESHTVPVELEAGKEYEFAFETSNAVLGAFRAQLYWKTPEIYAREAVAEPRAKTRGVYLPAGATWIDFWTGETLAGGRSITADAPIERIPLLVRAGSIVPMGPFVQYAAEKADPIELRIYAGANGSFTMYEDENDNYNYERGAYSTIDFRWDDAKRQLSIGRRNGAFPGMLKERTFQVVVVKKGQGTGVDLAAQPDRTITYTGEPQTVSLPAGR